ncbi:transcriptional regulator, LysR family [Sideroxydans lithotrophicus ES-1]|uniref:Transcriptional regulator, LysR family n=2 Tax=Sideroxydans TaxID=314343 RepID=D5CQ58_SIDLE|nr:LysR family transcriptional regulator [Sideroxydans lithotrophicus]ADE11222.1 transcriptional regulator, LysR family [Sideroxydans lithotrophicus ES-1]
MMKNATLRQLKVFESVARNLSYTRAAEELYLTQPTVSIQIKQLTDIVGLPLLEQIGKRIYLTDPGRELLKVCRNIFEDMSRFEMLVSDMKGVKAGKLNLAIITTAKYFVPRLLGLFCQRYPGIDVSLKVTNRERVLQRLADNQDDLYVLGAPPEDMDIEIEPFLENPLVVLAASNHALAAEKNISLQRLTEEQFLMREQGSGIRLATEQFFAERGLKLKVRMELGSNEAIKQAVVGGLGIAVLSAHTLALDRDSQELAILDVQGFPIQRHWYLAHPKEKQLSVVALAFLEFLHKESKLVGEKYLQGIPGFPTRKNGGKDRKDSA